MTVLSEAQAAFACEAAYPQWLAELAGDVDWRVSSGSTWLLLDHLKQGNGLSAAPIQKLVGSLDDLSHWSAKLHVCQSIRHLHLDAVQASRFADWLETMLEHKRPFIRAWALDGMVSLGTRFDSLSGRAAAALDAADKDEAASVRARARNLR